MTVPISVVLVDDQPLVLAGLRLLLTDMPDIEIVGEATDGAGAVALAQRLRPDVVLMDVRMPGMDGIEATRRLREKHERQAPPGESLSPHQDTPRVIALTTFDDDQTAQAVIAAGVHGFMLKHASSAELGLAIRRVAQGQAWLDPSVGARMLAAWHPQSPTDLDIETPLTPRERQVLALVAAGATNEDISREFVLSVTTVKTHLARILVKTGATHRAALVALAHRSGFVHRHDTSTTIS